MMLQTQIFSPAPEFGINFSVGGRNLTFGPREFCLITGLVFGEQSPEITVHDKSFKDRLFGDKKDHNLTIDDLLYLFRNHLDILDDVDAIRICLLLLVEHDFKGGEGKNFVDKTMLYLVNDLGAWNTFPWGSYLWRNTYPYIHDALQKNCRQNRKKMLNYSLKGFTWAFKKGYIPSDICSTLHEINLPYYRSSCYFWGETSSVDNNEKDMPKGNTIPQFTTHDYGHDNNDHLYSINNKMNYIRHENITTYEVLQQLYDLAKEKSLNKTNRATTSNYNVVKSPQNLFTPLNETNDFKDPFTPVGGNQFIYQNINIANPSVVEMNFEEVPLAQRRGKRAMKPSAVLLSPFGVISTTPNLKKNQKDELKDIMDLYKSGMSCKTALTDSVKLTSEFWRSLLLLDGSAGWLETNVQ
ncbi:hypothetical protein E3N88_06180 [Mikania micrantha]|uniref:DUF1985 domain-containing protein n=1 Tax=Mikania micrantha TaxID=192012 RepID=A0A5N6PN01_9ASTR|nr:hypothetical protein E3N88_06180 [Mikania micrantha]